MALVTDALAYYYLRNPLPIDLPLPKPLVPPPWRVEILASDISYSVLRAGQDGTYNEHQMSTVDYGYRLRYFVDQPTRAVHVIYLGPHPDRDTSGRERAARSRMNRERNGHE